MPSLGLALTLDNYLKSGISPWNVAGNVLSLVANRPTPTSGTMSPWVDQGKYGNDATLSNFSGTATSGWVQELINGVPQNFLETDGIDDFLSLINAQSLDVTTEAIAVFMTVRKFNSGVAGYLLYKGLRDTATAQYGLTVESNGASYVMLNGVNRGGGLTNDSNGFDNIGFYYDKSYIELYKNGVRIYKTAYSEDLTSRPNVRIACRSNSDNGSTNSTFYKGAIATASVYKGGPTLNISSIIKTEMGQSRRYKNQDGYTKYVAHRGLSSQAPENTMPAYELAGQNGYYAYECDVLFTADNIPILMHDDTVDRTTDGTGAVSSLTWAQIQAMTIDIGPNIESYPNTKVPHIDEYLAKCVEYGAVPFIEAKADYTTEQVAILLDRIARYGLLDTCVILSFTTSVLTKIRAQNPSICLMPLLVITQANIDIAKDLGNNVMFGAHHTDATQANIRLMHKNLLKLNVWTLDDDATRDVLVSRNIDFITTNALNK